MVSFGTAVGTFGAFRNALKFNVGDKSNFHCDIASVPPENIDKILWIFINKEDSILIKLLLNLSLNYIRQPETFWFTSQDWTDQPTQFFELEYRKKNYNLYLEFEYLQSVSLDVTNTWVREILLKQNQRQTICCQVSYKCYLPTNIEKKLISCSGILSLFNCFFFLCLWILLVNIYWWYNQHQHDSIVNTYVNGLLHCDKITCSATSSPESPKKLASLRRAGTLQSLKHKPLPLSPFPLDHMRFTCESKTTSFKECHVTCPTWAAHSLGNWGLV